MQPRRVQVVEMAASLLPFAHDADALDVGGNARTGKAWYLVPRRLGDGVNDAPSLARADLRIALGSGTAIATQAAPLILTNRALTGVLDTPDLAGRTFQIASRVFSDLFSIT